MFLILKNLSSQSQKIKYKNPWFNPVKSSENKAHYIVETISIQHQLAIKLMKRRQQTCEIGYRCLKNAYSIAI